MRVRESEPESRHLSLLTRKENGITMKKQIKGTQCNEKYGIHTKES
jgi:hypothetical protein